MSARPSGRRALALASALALALLSCSSGELARREPRPVILLVLDTLRADHLGYHGYVRATSPNLDAFARQSLACRFAFTAAPWTPPSVATMLTGLYPSGHRHVPPHDRRAAAAGERRLSASLPTLPEILRQHGWTTAAVSSNPWITPAFGFDQGFETFELLPRQPAGAIVDAGIRRLDDSRRQAAPLFLYLHFLDPHDPYTPPAGYGDRFPAPLERPGRRYGRRMQQDLRAYDGEIAYLDAELGRFFAHLRRTDLYDRALIAVVGDHGEQFGEHGRTRHGNSLYDEEVRVPLFVRDPLVRPAAGVLEHPVSTVDLLPTLLDRLGLPAPAAPLHGLSLFDRPALARRPAVLSENRRKTELRALIGRDRRKVIFEAPIVDDDAADWSQPALVGIFDLENDTFERHPLTAEPGRWPPIIAAAFARVSLPEPADAALPAEAVSDETRQQLRALGYLR